MRRINIRIHCKTCLNENTDNNNNKKTTRIQQYSDTKYSLLISDLKSSETRPNRDVFNSDLPTCVKKAKHVHHQNIPNSLRIQKRIPPSLEFPLISSV